MAKAYDVFSNRCQTTSLRNVFCLALPVSAGIIPDVSLGRRIEAARIAKGLGLNELDRLAGIAPGTTSRIEADKRTTPGAKVLRKYATALGVTVDYLIMTDPVEVQGESEQSKAFARMAGGKYDLAIARIKEHPRHGSEAWPEEEWIQEVLREYQRTASMRSEPLSARRQHARRKKRTDVI